MRISKMVGRALGVEHTVVERVRVNELERGFVVDVRPYSKHQNLCPKCLVPCPRYDAGSGRRSWRGHDFGLATVTLEADAPRVLCAEHGVHPLYVAYLLKEQLRAVFVEKGWQGAFMIQQWVAMARSSGLAPFKAVANSIENHLEGIQHALMTGLSNGITKSSNNGLHLLTRIAYGFHTPEPLIALAMLKRGGLCPPLPRLTH